MVAGTDIDVRRHVNEVPGSGRERGEPLRRRKRGLGMRGSFNGVDVEMICADVVGIALQHGLEHGHNLISAGRGLAFAIVELPRVEVHAAFGEKRRGIEIIGVGLIRLSHRVVVGGFETIVIGIGRVGVTLGEGLNVIALVARSVCGKRHSLLHVLVGQLLSRVIYGQVVVGSEHQRDAPIGHGHVADQSALLRGSTAPPDRD